jgi:hypothetical protein
METLQVIGQIQTMYIVAMYSCRAGSVLYKLTSGEEELVDEAYLEAEDLVHDLTIDAALAVATFGAAKFLPKLFGFLRGANKKIEAVARFKRNIEYGGRAEQFILGSPAKKTAFKTALSMVIPDEVTATAIKEVKNVKYLTNTAQMKKMVQLAKGGDSAGGEPARKLILHVRKDTDISKPLLRELNELHGKGLFELITDIPPALAP